MRFNLTAEAGLNDGLAFPFVGLGIALAAHGAVLGRWTVEWFAVDVLWKLGAGVAAGWAVGRALGWLTFHMPSGTRLARTGDGFVALGVAFLAYGLAETAHGYGFLAVFVAAMAMRDSERRHDHHERLYGFAEQTERLLMMVLLVLFGGALAGGLLDPLTWADAAAVALFVFVVRPAAGLASLWGSPQPLDERASLAFFGIRGLGSFYYLAYALNHVDFGEADRIWAVVGATVLLSVVLHGVTATPAMRLLDRRRAQGALPLRSR